ncbi:hypothetical protein BDZ97DRAFT_1589099, partial [Flammula alnicola]
GSIMDGDDNTWSGDKKVLEGDGDGGWKELVGRSNSAISSAIAVGETMASP